MFKDFYGYSEEPFRLTPDARFCFQHRSFAKARAYFQYALDHGEGFVLVTGRPGTGKTMLIDDLLAELAESRLLTFRIESAQMKADDLVRRIAYGFGLDPTGLDKATILHDFERRLDSRAQNGERALLIVDEAQILSVEALEELRLLTNLRPYGRSLIQIFLVGQDGLRDLIRLPKLEQLHQRVLCACHLEPLTLREARDYIAHRLECAAWVGDPVIEAAAVTAIHRASDGIPRLINKFMDRLLLHGWLEGRHRLGGGDARTVLGELRHELLLTAPEEGDAWESKAEGVMHDITDIDRPTRFLADQTAKERLEMNCPGLPRMQITSVLSEEPLVFDGSVSNGAAESADQSSFDDLFVDPKDKDEDRHEGQGVFACSDWLDPPLSTLGDSSTPVVVQRDAAASSDQAQRQSGMTSNDEAQSRSTIMIGLTGASSTGRIARQDSGDSRVRRHQGSSWLNRVFVFLILTALILGIILFRSFPRSFTGSLDLADGLIFGPTHSLNAQLEGSEKQWQGNSGALVYGHPSADSSVSEAPTSENVLAFADDSPVHAVEEDVFRQAESDRAPRVDASTSDYAVAGGVAQGVGTAPDIESVKLAKLEAEYGAAGYPDPAVFSTSQTSRSDLEPEPKKMIPTLNSDANATFVKESSIHSSDAASEGSLSSGPKNQFPSALGVALTELGLDTSEFNGRFAVNLRQFVPFEFDSSDLSPESQAFLRQLGAVLVNYPSLKIQVLGHTDDIGNPQYNEQLSFRRAEAVIRYLSTVGIDLKRLEAIGVGHQEPLFSPDSPSFSPAQRQYNRRIELTIVPEI